MLTTDPPPTSHFGKFQMAISPRGVFGSRVGFSMWADRMTLALFRVGPNSIGGPYVGENNARGVIRLVTI